MQHEIKTITTMTVMKLMRSALAALGLVVTLNACAQNKTSDKPNKKKGDNMEIVHLTKAEFLKNVYNYEANPNAWKFEGDQPCLIDFYATWCGPCKALAPVLEELAKEYDGKIRIYKIDVDQEEELAGAFGIRSIPTLLWIPQNGTPTVTQGAMPRPELKKMIDSVLLNAQ